MSFGLAVPTGKPIRSAIIGTDAAHARHRIHPRSMEMFESFGLDQEISQAWEPITGWALWRRDGEGTLARSDRMDNPTPVRCR